MATLCIDIGNTSTHYGLVEGRRVEATGDFPTASLLDGPAPEFTRVLEPLLARAAGAAFCSVVPAANPGLTDSLERLAAPVFHLAHDNCPGLDLAYPEPAEIGEDRLANAIAAQEYFGIPAVVVDMGTAVTFDIVTSAGYEGGIIAPGLAVMTRYLHEQTALLPELRPADLVQVEGAIGKSTVHAMKLGVAVGFTGMIDALLRRVLDQLESRGEGAPVVLATGGSTANLTADWSRKSRFVDHLTLVGLAVAKRRAAG
jgi:type III pantothenate kinase